MDWRTASDLAIPAFVASRVSARPAVMSCFAKLFDAGIGSVSLFSAAYDARTARARSKLEDALSEDLVQKLDITLERAAEDAQRLWEAIVMGRQLHIEDEEANSIVPRVVEDEMDSQGGPDRRILGPKKMQAQIFAFVDEHNMRQLGMRLHAEHRYADIRRIRELRSPECDKQWLHTINKTVAPVLSASQFSVAVKLMLGASFLHSPVVCKGCGSHTLDTSIVLSSAAWAQQ